MFAAIYSSRFNPLAGVESTVLFQFDYKLKFCLTIVLKCSVICFKRFTDNFV